MADKKKRGSDTPKSETKIVLRDLKTSEYAKKKYTVKKNARYIPPTGNYADVRNGTEAEETVGGKSQKDRKQKSKKAQSSFAAAKKDHSREKRAAYIKENIRNEIAASYSEQFDEPVFEESFSPKEELQELSSEKAEDKPVRKVKTDSPVSAEKEISSEKAERMKKAAFIKEKLQKDIAAGKAASASDDEHILSDNIKETLIKGEAIVSDARKSVTESVVKRFNQRFLKSPVGTETKGDAFKEKSESRFESSYLGNTEHISENKHKNSLESAEVRQAYKGKILETQMNRRKEAVVMHSQAQTNAALISAEKAKTSALKSAEAEEFTRDNIISGAEMAAGYISAVKNGDAVGMITQPAVSIIKNNMDSLSGISDSVSTISGAVQSSDSVGGAAVNAVTSTAAAKLKSAVSNSLFKPSDAKIEERLEKKFRYIDRKTDRQMNCIRAEKAKAMNGNIGKNLEKELEKIERSQEKFKQKLARQQKELQRRQQKNIFIQHNRNNPSFVGNKIKNKAAGTAGKSKLLLLGSGTSFLVVILIIIILLFIIASIFSWLTPYEYSLAGDESGEQSAATTEEEIIDGYAKLIKNYIDVTQAYYYYTYGDWYGGEYDYPSPDISFSEYLAEYQDTVIEQIQAKYEALFAAAQSYQEIMALSQAMTAEMTAALQAAEQQARIEYDHLMSSVDDTMSANERRQPYEVYDGGGGNGSADSAEFTGKPIVGTNSFGNVEINSDLSVEELLAMTALYKSLKGMDETEKAETDTEEMYNITPDDIMEFFKETEFISITAEITHDNTCDGRCKRRMIGDYETGYSWEYYCDGDHDWLSGEIGACKTKDELIAKIIELTNAEDNGVDEESAEEIIEAYLDTINEKLGISESDYRQFGASDNERAKAFYEMLIDPEQGEIPNNFWTVETPFSDGESEESADE